jgi:hypothetical protein
MQKHKFHFESVFELGDAVAELHKTGHREPKSRESSEGYDNGNRFYGGFSMREAIDTGQGGGYWEEGARALSAIDLDVSAEQDSAINRLQNDITGFLPDVPAYLAGRPESMFTLAPQANPNRFINIGVHIGRSEGVTQREALNRGRAILALVDELSMQGYGVQITAVWRNYGESVAVSVDTIVKHASATWNPAACAFALANVAFQRRLIWRFVEGQEGAAMITRQGYGGGTREQGADFDIFLPYMNERHKHYGTPAKSLDYVHAIAARYFKSLDTAA